MGPITDNQDSDADGLEPIPLQYRYDYQRERNSGLARRAALENHRRGVPILLLVAAVQTVWWWAQFDRLEDGRRIWVALVCGLISGVATAVLVLVVNRFGFKLILGKEMPGAVESGFGESAFVLKTSDMFARIDYSAVKWIEHRAEIVWVKYRDGTKVLYPIELFPPDAVRSRIPEKRRLGHR